MTELLRKGTERLHFPPDMLYLYLPGTLTNRKIQRTETARSFYGRSLTERLGFAFSTEQIDKRVDPPRITHCLNDA